MDELIEVLEQHSEVVVEVSSSQVKWYQARWE
jgi:hypothetical protein